MSAGPAFADAIWTTTGSCGEPQNINTYAIGETVYVNGSGFDADTYAWSITGKPGGASCDPNGVVASGNVTVNGSCSATGGVGGCTGGDGAFCFPAYVVQSGDCGVYQVKVGVKGDNYNVAAPPPVGDVTFDINKSALLASGNIVYTVSVENTGEEDAHNVVVADVLPPDVTFVSAGGTGWSCGESDGTVTCTRSSLNSGVTAPDITIEVSPGATGYFHNGACVTSDEQQTPTCDATDTYIEIEEVPTTTPTTPVPTMTEGGMAVFVFLSGLGSLYFLRRKRKG